MFHSKLQAEISLIPQKAVPIFLKQRKKLITAKIQSALEGFSLSDNFMTFLIFQTSIQTTVVMYQRVKFATESDVEIEYQCP